MNSLVTTTTAKGLMLTLPQERALERLEADDRKLIEAALFPSIRKVEESSAFDFLLTVVGNIYIIAGQAADEKQKLAYTSLLYRRLMEEFPMVTLQEVKQALENGAYGGYGELYGFHPRSFIKCIREYLSDVKRRVAKEEFSNLKRLKAPVEQLHRYWEDEFWTEKQIEDWRREAETHYQYYKSGNKLWNAMPEAVYWLLRRERKIEMNQDYVDQLMDEAKIEYKIQLLATVSQDKERLLHAVHMGNDKIVNARIRLDAKRLAVRHFFASIAQQHDNILW